MDNGKKQNKKAEIVNMLQMQGASYDETQVTKT